MYEVIWIRKGRTDDGTIYPSDTTVELTGLQPNTKYNIQVLDLDWNPVG